jgi:SAM-dependent methyltransferase
MGLRDRLFATVYEASTRKAEEGWLGEIRAELLGGLTGRVLEVGAGAGANLRHYRMASGVVAVEPSSAMRARLTARLGRADVPVEVVYGKAEALPYENEQFDAIVYTLVLCSVRDVRQALAEARRVLRPGGRLVLLEHVRGTGRAGRRQDRFDPLWSRLTSGCHLNRDTAKALEAAGFDASGLQSFTPEFNNPLTSPLIRGEARAQDQECDVPHIR